MKNHKILVVLLIGIFITSSTGGFLRAGNISNTNNANTDTTDTTIEIKNCHLNIGEPTLSSQDVNGNEFVTIKLDESETFMSHSGEPMLPVITRTFDFPIGTKINAVNVNINWERLDLDKKVTPTPVMVPNSDEITPDPAYIEEKRIDENIYSSTELYPTEPYTIKYGSGLKDMEHVIFVNVKCFPQYSPANNYVNIPTDIDINIEYEAAETPASFAEQYDLIIITHDVLKNEFQRLADHKISHGVTTKLVTVGEIYENYLGTATNYTWEAIKMYLADHVMNWDTKYVLLAGGHIGQTYDWYVPDFRSNNFDINDDPYYPHYDVTFSSDLYYADVYYTDQYGHQKFDNWNSNKNSIYAEGPASLTGTDVMDFYPDVGLGRLPVRYTWEAKTVVDKIIDYENNAADSWYKRVAIAGGDSFPWERYPGQATPGIWEGEIEGDVFAEMFADKGFTSTKMYCSDQGDILVTGAADCYNEVSKGYGFYCADGHANAFSLGSYKPDTGIMPPPITEFYSGFNVIQYKNKNKLFFGLFDGCHNAQIETTAQKIINQLFSENPDPEFILSRYEWLPSDSESFFVTMKGGGAIGLVGNTALGLGGIDYGITEFVGGWIQLRFAEGYIYANQENTGAMWAYGITGYIDNFDVNFDAGDRKTIEERILLGDPSVKLGGYHTGSLSETDDSEETEVNYGPVSASVPTWSVGDSWTYKLDNLDWNLNLTEDRAITLKLSTGDIKLEVTEVTSDSYITSITSDNLDVTLGGMFNFHEDNLKEGIKNINIPEISLNDISITGQIIIDKETLGFKAINPILTVDLIKNLDKLKDILGIELPKWLNIFIPYMSIPANIQVKMEFDNPLEVIQFPIEKDKIWGIPANTVTISIDGSVESVWLRLLTVINKFIKIVPDDIAIYLPNIDISQLLNDRGIDTTYTIDIPEIPADLMPYHSTTTPFMEALGSENIKTDAGSFDAAVISIIERNGEIYYSDDVGFLIKGIGYFSEYIPILQDLNIELKSYTHQ